MLGDNRYRKMMKGSVPEELKPVSYTHLDVYKRQLLFLA